MKEALEDMVWQFAYHGQNEGKPFLYTGGLSALESAFSVLGWDDPHYIEDTNGSCCDVEGCGGQIVCGGSHWRESGYWCICARHSEMARSGHHASPQMKERAMLREKGRDAKGVLP